MTWVIFQIKAGDGILRLETAFNTRMHNVARLAPCQPVSSFSFSLLILLLLQAIHCSDLYAI
jgi:hypothetical protein